MFTWSQYLQGVELKVLVCCSLGVGSLRIDKVLENVQEIFCNLIPEKFAKISSTH